MKIIFEEALSIVFSELVCRYGNDPELETHAVL